MSKGDEVVNKTIAEFMGHEHDELAKEYCGFCGNHFSYTTSLDALVPVWEKLEVEPSFVIYPTGGEDKKWESWMEQRNRSFSSEYGDTMQQAAAYATCKAIMKIEK